MGLANLRAAIELGVTRFDSSVAGLGGCPFIPGAVGNISTERAIEAIQSMGFESGINLEAVRAVGKDLEKLLR
jgi:hydroxymethylglutaryl-CoA lyase